MLDREKRGRVLPEVRGQDSEVSHAEFVDSLKKTRVQDKDSESLVVIALRKNPLVPGPIRRLAESRVHPSRMRADLGS